MDSDELGKALDKILKDLEVPNTLKRFKERGYCSLGIEHLPEFMQMMEPETRIKVSRMEYAPNLVWITDLTQP